MKKLYPHEIKFVKPVTVAADLKLLTSGGEYSSVSKDFDNIYSAINVLDARTKTDDGDDETVKKITDLERRIADIADIEEKVKQLNTKMAQLESGLQNCASNIIMIQQRLIPTATTGKVQ